MKRLPILLASSLGMIPLLAGCGSAGGSASFVRPGKIMQEVIQERIDQIPYQHGEELFANMLWLKQSGEQTIPALTDALDHRVPKVRSSAAWVLGSMGDKRAITYLQEHTSDPSPIVRLEIARSLLLLGDHAQIPVLISGLESEFRHIRYLCFSVLKETTGKRFGYDVGGEDVVATKKSLERWRQWWKSQEGEEWFKNRGQVVSPPSGN